MQLHENYRLHISEESSAFPVREEKILGSSQQLGCLQSGSQKNSNELPLQRQLLWCWGLWMQGKCFVANAFSAFSQLCVQLLALQSVRQQQHTDPAQIPYMPT